MLGQAEAWSCIWISMLAGTGPRAWPSPAAVPGALAGTEVVQLGLEPVTQDTGLMWDGLAYRTIIPDTRFSLAYFPYMSFLGLKD